MSHTTTEFDAQTNTTTGTPVTDQTKKLGEFGHAGDDHVVPFEVGPLDVRGRAVQLGPVLDEILNKHAYPEPVARQLAEAAVITVLLGSSLKFQGKFILQTQTDGPISMLVVDFTTPGALRAYARFDKERLDAVIGAGQPAPADLLGKGVLALTIDQGEHTQRYQGIVQLEGGSLEEAALTYFRQSEQIPTDIKLAVARQMVRGDGSHWRAGGLLTQFLPKSPERMRTPDIHGGDGDPNKPDANPVDNSWQEALSLLATIEADELVDPAVNSELLLYRLFHEQGVRVFEGAGVKAQCSCSRDKIKGVLSGFTAEEIEHSTENGKIKVDCEFCSSSYEFDPADFAPAQ